ncbi:MAG: ABC transporter substrate-binding protein [Minisyncoccia bacterium]
MCFLNFVIHLWHKFSLKEKGIFIFSLTILLVGLSWSTIILIKKITIPVPKEGGTLTFGLVGHFSYLNPVLSQSNDCDRDLNELIYNGLYEIDGQGGFKPSLADKIEISPDGKTYTVFLKEKVFWHDGVPFTADDVIFTIETIQNPEIKSPLYLSWKGVVVEKISNSAVRFDLQNSYEPFLQNLTLKIIPKHVWENIQPEDIVHTEYNIKPIGTGPYLFDNLNKSPNGKINSYSLVSNDNYFDGKPKINRIVFRLYNSPEEAKAALLKNEVNALSPLSISDYNFFANKKDYQIVHLFLPRYFAVFFNLNNSLFSSPDFRQALSLAIDRNQLVKTVLQNQAFPLSSPISPGFWSYQNFDNEYDQNKAIVLINKLKAASAKNKKVPQDFSFTLSLSDDPELINVANFLASSFKAIGVNMSLQILPLKDLEKNVIQNRSYQALLFGEIIGQDPDLFTFWHSSQASSQGLNLSNYQNTSLDKLLEEERQILDQNQRLKDMQQIQTILHNDNPALFLYNPYYLILLPKKVQNINVQYVNLPSEQFSQIENWFLYTKRQLKLR